MPRSFTNLLLIACHALPGTAWLIEQHATLTILPMVGEDRTLPIPVISPAPLPSTVTPTSTITSYGRDGVTPVAGFGYAALNVTTEYLILPNRTDLPLSTLVAAGENPSPSTSVPDPTITTKYYLPLTVSNLASCTLTEYTYTEGVQVGLPSTLQAQATDESLATLVTTYTSTISTNLGGQAVTTAVCDIYLRGDAVPLRRRHPRRETCSAGGNVEATGSGGCSGVYPPTSTGDAEPEPTETGGATSWRAQSCFAYISLLVFILGYGF
ncbi:uncharacterized protein BJX67DRAFT_375509 [Aspergillus lucknowensis]|uniref:Uncharacterized protein n=1 Tax=Aspergillus lucknowensis TaxID=176173 RepID=A0ABR4L9N7_9EURO